MGGIRIDNMKEIFREVLHKGLVQEIGIKKLLIDKQSKYQRIQIFDTFAYGRVLTLDGVVQLTEKDESAYSEMLSHPIICALNKPSNVLIIGGGDGAVAEEVLKYKFIKEIDLVDIDADVVYFSKKYLKKINNYSLENKRLKIFNEDAFDFVNKVKKEYDIIIADRPDPIGAGKSLFKLKFYKYLDKILSDKGFVIFQSGVPFLQKDEIKEVMDDVKRSFKYRGILLTVVPSYIGGYMALVWASNNIKLDKVEIDLKKLKGKTNYINKEILKSAFAIPNFIKDYC